MALQTARVTFLTTPEFKLLLKKEADRAGVSISELIRMRCEKALIEDDISLKDMVAELKKVTKRVNTSLDTKLKKVQKVLVNMKRDREKREKRQMQPKMLSGNIRRNQPKS